MWQAFLTNDLMFHAFKECNDSTWHCHVWEYTATLWTETSMFVKMHSEYSDKYPYWFESFDIFKA